MSLKTIQMPKELLAQWLADLRSGKFKQATGAMYSSHQEGYCCLGVLARSAGYTQEETHMMPGLPSQTMLSEKGIKFGNRFGQFKWPESNPYLPSLECFATTANDNKALSFSEIADAIEACAEGV